jgi:glutamyl-tRNA synthetase
MQDMIDQKSKVVRTRIAPSPTGYPHIGTIYQALFNYAFAKKYDGQFLVRIEDTDRARFVEGAEDAIFSYLDWVELSEDESPRKDGVYGPYRQSERLSIYHTYAEELLQKGGAYYAYYPKSASGEKDHTKPTQNTQNKFATSEEKPKSIAEMIERGDWIVRLIVPQDAPIVIHDQIRGEISFDPKQVTEQVLIKSDGFPTYHFAVVVDDHLMGVTHIVRAEEWLPSTPKHMLLYKYFGWTMPPVYHTSTLRNPDKSKLSKRHGHTNVGWYKEQGYLPEAILNYLGLLGWSHPEEKEIFSLKEFIEVFELKDIRPIAPIFDLKKLEWMSGEYIRMMEHGQLQKRLVEFDQTLEKVEHLEKFVIVAQTRMKKLLEFKDLIMPFVEKQEVASTDEQKELKIALHSTLESLQNWDVQTLTDTLLSFAKEHSLNFKKYYRMILGRDSGLPLADSFAILGKEKTLELLS